MPAMIALAQSAQPQSVSLTYPVVFSIVAVLLAAGLVWKWPTAIDRWLASEKSRRVAVQALTLLCGVGAVVTADLIDFSAVADGAAVARDRFCIPWFVAFSAVGGLLTLASFRATEEIQDALTRAGDSAAVSKYQQRDHDTAVAMTLALTTVFESRRREIASAITQPESRKLAAAIRVVTGYFAARPKTEALIEALHVCLDQRLSGQRRLSPQERAQISLRVALFVEDAEGYMVAACSFDGAQHDCIRSPQKEHRAHFRLGGDPDNLVTYCAEFPTEPLIYGDAARAHQDPNSFFTYFGEDQRSLIRSIAAQGLRDGDVQDGPRMVISMDCNIVDFFNEQADKEALRLLVRAFGPRIRLEQMLVRSVPPPASTLEAKS